MRSRVPEPRVLFSMARRSSRDITALVRHGIGSLAGGAAEIHPGPTRHRPPRYRSCATSAPGPSPSLLRRAGAASQGPPAGGCLLHATGLFRLTRPDRRRRCCAPRPWGALVEEQPGVTGRTSGSPRLPLGQRATAHTPGRPHRILLGSVARFRIRSDVEPSRRGPPCAADAPPLHPVSRTPPPAPAHVRRAPHLWKCRHTLL